MKRRTTGALALATALFFTATMSSATAADHAMLDPFTADELADNWIADRLYPSGGVESIAAHGRTDVAAISMDSTQASDSGSWWGYEGIKKIDDFGTAVQVDLYVPGEWQDTPVNAGFWASDVPTISAYPIIAFRNSEAVDAGFYAWDGATWASVTAPVSYDGWNTFEITLDPGADEFTYRINGHDAGSLAADGDSIGQVYLNQYNYGAIDPENAVDYTTFWHAGVTDPVTADDCRDGAWEDAGFANQGQCIRFVNTGKDSR